MHYLLIILDNDKWANFPSSSIEILVTVSVIIIVAVIAALCYCSKYKGRVSIFS